MLFKKLIATLLIFSLNAQASTLRVIEADSITSSDKVKTFTLPSISTSLVGKDTISTATGNLLLNPYMELGNTSGVATGWTNSSTGSTATITTSAGEFAEGLQAQKIALSSGVLNYYQSVSVPSGSVKQGKVGITYKVDSSISGFQICSLIDGSEQICVPTADLVIDGLYHTKEIPVTFGTTSAGVKAKSLSSTGNVFLDFGFVQQGLNYQTLTNNKDAFLVPITGTWSTNTTYTNYVTIVGDRAYFEGIITFSGAPNSSILQLALPSGYVIDTSKVPATNTRASFPSVVKVFDTSAGTQPGVGVVQGIDTTHVQLDWISGSSLAAINETSPMVFASGDSVYYSFNIPIVGLSSFQNVYSTGSTGLSVGDISTTAASTCPSGTLLADGSAISRTTYGELFAKIGITHGQGDGSTTFNLPDYRGRFLRGVDGGSGRDSFTRSAMATGGNATGVGSVQNDATKKNGLALTDPGHNHTQNAHAHAITDPGHVHSGINKVWVAYPGGEGAGQGTTLTQSLNTGSATTGISINNATATNISNTTGITLGAGDSETTVKNSAVNFCIRSSSSLIYGSFANTLPSTGLIPVSLSGVTASKPLRVQGIRSAVQSAGQIGVGSPGPFDFTNLIIPTKSMVMVTCSLYASATCTGVSDGTIESIVTALCSHQGSTAGTGTCTNLAGPTQIGSSAITSITSITTVANGSDTVPRLTYTNSGAQCTYPSCEMTIIGQPQIGN